MKHTFIKLITAALFTVTVAAASARAGAVTQSTILDAPAEAAFLRGQPYIVAPSAFGLTTTDFLTPSAGGTFAAPGGVSPLGDIGYYSLGSVGSFAAGPAKTWETFPATGPKVSVPLPEPSSETALYFLSGGVGLALVVMRRRTLA